MSKVRIKNSSSPIMFVDLPLLRSNLPPLLSVDVGGPRSFGPLRSKAPDSAWLPGRIKLLRWGENPSIQGPVFVGKVTEELLALNAHKFGRATLPIDFEHATVPGTTEYDRTQEPRPVAGYGVPRIFPGDGLWLDQIEWTPAGLTSAVNFRDLSPAVYLDSGREVTFMHSVALTRAGAVFGLGFPEGLKSAGVCLAAMAAGGARLSA